MIEHEGTQIFPSLLDDTLQVVIVYPESNNYEKVKPQFDKSGHAFLLHEYRMIMVDGAIVSEPWFTVEHLLVIQAHELAHFRAGHAVSAHGVCSEQIEKEADWLGYRLLLEKKEHNAASLHKEEYYSRYGNGPDVDSGQFEKKLGQFIN